MIEPDQELIDAIEQAWLSASLEGMGGYVVMDGTVQRVFSRLEMEVEALDRPDPDILARVRAHLGGGR